MCCGIRGAAAFVMWSDHYALVDAGKGPIVCKEGGEEERAREEEGATPLILATHLTHSVQEERQCHSGRH